MAQSKVNRQKGRGCKASGLVVRPLVCWTKVCWQYSLFLKTFTELTNELELHYLLVNPRGTVAPLWVAFKEQKFSSEFYWGGIFLVLAVVKKALNHIQHTAIFEYRKCLRADQRKLAPAWTAGNQFCL